MHVRELTQSDLIDDSFIKTLGNLARTEGLSRKRAQEVLREIQTNPLHRIFVAKLGGEVVCSTTLLIEPKFIHNGGRAGHIEDVVTRLGRERQGIGSAVMTRAIEEAEQQGCYRATLFCDEHNVKFYEKLGFERQDQGEKLQVCMRLKIKDTE